MPIADDRFDSYRAQIVRYHERLYRLALLLAGDPKLAAKLVAGAYSQLPDGLALEQAEPCLIAGLLDMRALRRARWRLQPADPARTTLDQPQLGALLRALGALPPAARLAVGLAYINGSSPDEIDALVGPDALAEGSAAALAGFRIEAARAAGLVPAEASPDDLERLERWAGGQLDEAEQLELRRDLIARADLRAVRDGLLAVRELLPRAIPPLVAATPPPDLTAQLHSAGDQPASPGARPGARRARLLLAAGVLLIASLIVVLPAWLGRLGQGASGATAISSPAELIEAALHRFDRAPLQAGVLHERYLIEHSDRTLVIERWYDYASPNRLAVRVIEAGEQSPLLQISSDGRSLAQFRYGAAQSFGQRPLDLRLSEDEARAIVPLLRSQPSASLFGRGGDQPGDIGPLFLAQARAAGATLLGQASVLGRQALLLSYQTDQPPLEQPGEQVRVVLTIDAQTYALLGVALAPAGEGESAARRPVRGELVELLAEAPDAPFQLPSEPGVIARIGIASVRFPFIDSTMQITIDDAAERLPNRLLAPLQLPDQQMRGLAIRNGGSENPEDVVLLYEGEFQNIIVLPSYQPNGNQLLFEEQSAGAFRYRVVSDDASQGGMFAVVYPADAPDQAIGVIFNDDLATSDERRERLAALVASLAPVNEQNLPLLRQTFVRPAAAGAQR